MRNLSDHEFDLFSDLQSDDNRQPLTLDQVVSRVQAAPELPDNLWEELEEDSPETSEMAIESSLPPQEECVSQPEGAAEPLTEGESELASEDGTDPRQPDQNTPAAESAPEAEIADLPAPAVTGNQLAPEDAAENVTASAHPDQISDLPEASHPLLPVAEREEIVSGAAEQLADAEVDEQLEQDLDRNAEEQLDQEPEMEENEQLDQLDLAEVSALGSEIEVPEEAGFAGLGLPTEILDRLVELGFEQPTPIQEKTIPLLMQGLDVVGVAQTGTGKTAAFGLPILANCSNKAKVQALILSPTRELAQQSANALAEFSTKQKRIKVVPVYGGSAYGPQIGALRDGAQIVVGTPGRVMDLMERGELKLDSLQFFVLDEADEMLRMGFAEDVDTIAKEANPEAIRALFSATMPPAIQRVAREHLKDPVEVSVAPQSSTVETVYQTYAVVPFKFKQEALARVLATAETQAAIVFVRTRIDAEQVASDLVKDSFKAAAISGDVPQAERERIVQRLRSGSLDVLVATDVAARGLDVERIGLVVNYDVPRESEAYVHRVGRTGRAGREGKSVTFFTPRERSRLRQIEKLTGTKMEKVQIPSPDQVNQARASRTLERIEKRLNLGEMEIYFDAIQDLVNTTGMDIGDIAAALLALSTGDNGPTFKKIKSKVRREEKVDHYGRFLSAVFEEGRDSDRERPRGKGGSRPFTPSGGKMYRIEVGRRDGVKPAAIVGAITGEGGIRGKDLGHIDIRPSFSLVEIPEGLSADAQKRISKAKVAGRKLRISEDTGPKKGKKRFRK